MHYAFADYYRAFGARELAHQAKSGSEQAINQMAQDLTSLMINLDTANAVLVPIPSRHGFATETLRLSHKLSLLCGIEVVDALKGNARESLYDFKKSGKNVCSDFFNFKATKNLNNKVPIILDTVFDTGQTMNCAAKLFNHALTMTHSQVNLV